VTTFADVTLEVARVLGIVREGIVTTGGTTTFTDSNMAAETDVYKNGTVWFLSGTSIGLTSVIKRYSASVFTLVTSRTTAVGNLYAVATSKFPQYIIDQAVNYVLRRTLSPKIDVLNTVSAGECTLTVSNIKRVIVDDVRNYSWREVGGKLLFDDAELSGALELWYMEAHGESITGAINPKIVNEYLIWASVLYILRNYVANHEKDDPMINEYFLNEAIANEKQWKSVQLQNNIQKDLYRNRW
jgi:hypothetical protein